MTKSQIHQAIHLKGHHFILDYSNRYYHDCPGDVDFETPLEGISCNHCPFSISRTICKLEQKDTLTLAQSKWLVTTYPEFFI